MSSARTSLADAPSPWVPTGGLLLHIGPHKTGTTTVQEAFAERRDELAGLGIFYPGPYPADHDAVRSRLGTPGGWDDAVAPPHRATWSRLTAQTKNVDGTVVVSSEAFCHATVRQAGHVCEDLRPGRPHRAVATVRSFSEVVPSAWQEYVKAGWTTDYDTFLRSVLVDGPGAEGPTPTFWRRHDHGALVNRWVSALGADAVTVVVVTREKPKRLLDAFEDLLGLPRRTLPRERPASNRSMTVPEIELLRQVNVHLRPVLTWESYNALVRMGGLAHLVGARSVPDAEQRLALPTWADEAAQEYGHRAARRIRKSEVAVIGSLRRLREPGRVSEEPVAADTVAADAVALMASGMVVSAAARARRRGDEPRERDLGALAAPTAGNAAIEITRAARLLADLAIELDAESGSRPA